MRLLSLFSGGGGMDIGCEGSFTCLKKSINLSQHPDWIENVNGDYVKLKPTQFDIVFANDIFQSAQNLWCNYFKQHYDNPQDIYTIESIVDLVKKEKSGIPIFPKNIDVVTGGFPCQDFSICGKRLGFNSSKNHLGQNMTERANIENRGQLYMWFKEVIELTTPKIFIAENVKGLTNLGNILEIIQKDFLQIDNNGYLIFSKLLKSQEYGVPQSRERLFFIGIRKNALIPNALCELSKKEITLDYNPFPIPTHNPTNFVTCQDAFIDLEEPYKSNDPSQQKVSGAKYMGSHCQGQKEIKLNGLSPTIRSEHHGNIEFRRLSQEHGGLHTDELNQNLPERRLSVRECARIQTFPDSYEFILNKKDHPRSVSMNDAYKIIGNAVPPILAYNIIKNIESKWEKYFEKS